MIISPFDLLIMRLFQAEFALRLRRSQIYGQKLSRRNEVHILAHGGASGSVCTLKTPAVLREANALKTVFNSLISDLRSVSDTNYTLICIFSSISGSFDAGIASSSVNLSTFPSKQRNIAE